MISKPDGQAGQGGQGGQGEQVVPVDTSELKIKKTALSQKLEALQANLQEEKETKTYSLNPNHNIETLKTELEKLKTELESESGCTAKTTLISSCDKAIAICSELLADDPPEDVTAQHQQLADQITEVNKVTFANQDQGNNNGGQGGQDDGKMGVHERRAKEAEMRNEMMVNTQKRLDAATDRQYKQKEKMIELMANLKQLEGESQTAAKVIGVLVKGIALFGEISKKWMNLVLFFEKVKSMIDIGMAAPVEDLAKQGESGLKTRQAGRDLSNFKTKTISKVNIYF